MMTTTHTTIRWMIKRDLGEVLAIENRCFDCPWSESDFMTALRQRNAIAMVAEVEERVAGFMVYELHRQRIHVLNFAVDTAYQRRGVGSSMVHKLVSKLWAGKRDRIEANVRETNLPAQLFFKSCGFRAECVLENHYSEPANEAAYHFRYALGDV